jgi:hypothetical protein
LTQQLKVVSFVHLAQDIHMRRISVFIFLLSLLGSLPDASAEVCYGPACRKHQQQQNFPQIPATTMGTQQQYQQPYQPQYQQPYQPQYQQPYQPQYRQPYQPQYQQPYQPQYQQPYQPPQYQQTYQPSYGVCATQWGTCDTDQPRGGGCLCSDGYNNYPGIAQ